MLIVPLIDVKGGRCVRLVQGDHDRVTVFSDRPATVARRWQDEGAPWLHVADLDGARAGRPGNLEAIATILRAVTVPVQVGGGLRTRADVKALFDLGAARVVLSTAFVENPSLVAELASAWPGRIVVSVDARDGMVMIRGWQEQSPVRARDLAAQAERLGAAAIVYTDVDRDGTMTEPNDRAVAEIVSAVHALVIAGGGVSRIEHLERLRAVGARGAIVGRALYDGAIRLSDALALPE